MTTVAAASTRQKAAWNAAFVAISVLLIVAVLYKGAITFGLLLNPPFTFSNVWNLVPVVIGIWLGNKAMAPHTIVVFGCAGYVGPKWIFWLNKVQFGFSVLALALLFLF